MSPTVTVAPERTLVDERLDVEVRGLAPGRRVTLEVRTRLDDAAWVGEATFHADEDGVVDPARQSPVDGDYDGVRPMGPFQFARPADPDRLAPGQTRIRARVDGAVAASATCERRLVADGVTETPVEDDRVVGRVFVPPGSGPHPGVLVFGTGDDGGADPTPKLLASRGYAVLSLSYFGTGALPADPVEVPLEYFDTAVEWFADHPDVRDGPLGAFGRSLGARVALTVAARDDRVRTVVAYAPTAHHFESVAGGVGATGTATFVEDEETVEYVPLRWTLWSTLSGLRDALLGRTVSLRSAYRGGIEDASDRRLRRAAIPIEEVGGPVLLVAGEDDAVWPADDFGERIVDRLDDADYDHPYDHVVYEDAGHAIGVPYVPVVDRDGTEAPTRFDLATGGSPDGYATADAEAWQRTLQYLERGLRPEAGRERIR